MNRVDNINRGMGGMKPLQSVEIPSLQGKVSAERARDIYRVAIADRRVDAKTTEELRT